MKSYPINLLPPSVLESRKRSLVWWRVGRLLRLVILSQVLLLALIGSLVSIVLFQLQQLDVSDPAADSAQLQSVRNLNILSEKALIELRSSMLWSDRIEEVVALQPPQIFLAEIKVTTEPPALVLEGRSDLRPAVEQFNQALAELPWVRVLEAPLQNFATGEGAGFTITLLVK